MEDKIKSGYLYDFYGELLTEHQRSVYEMSINEDLSLCTGKDFSVNQVQKTPNQPAIYLYTSGSTGKSKLIPKDFPRLRLSLWQIPLRQRTSLNGA